MLRLHHELSELRALADRLAGDHQRLVEASVGSNADDEHDVEGASIAVERAHVQASWDRTLARIDTLTAALGRSATGSYGVCVDCAGPIGAERLAARPDAARCIACAR